MQCKSSAVVEPDLKCGGTFKIDSTSKFFFGRSRKMRNGKVTMVHAAINTDPLEFDDVCVHVSDRDCIATQHREVKHVHITNSNVIRESYEFGEILGRGCFGTVVEITDRQNNKTWALKVVLKTQVAKKIQALHREIQILKMVSHPHIIFLQGVYESAKKIYMILEKCNGELGRLFRNKGVFTEEETKEVMRQLASAVAYLHRNEIVHRDLKLENILLAENPENPKDNLYIKVIDFSLGIIKGHYSEMMTDRCGTLTYVSPEVITKGSYSQLCDVWSMGVIMYVLLTGMLPFYSRNERALVNLICVAEPNYSILNVTSEAAHLISKMLDKNPEHRITAAEIGMHPWLQGTTLSANKLVNVLEMMRMWRPDMMLPIGSECDWASTTMIMDNPATLRKKSDSRTIVTIRSASKTGKQSMKIPVHNIEFNRSTRGRTGGKLQQNNGATSPEKRAPSTGGGLPRASTSNAKKSAS